MDILVYANRKGIGGPARMGVRQNQLRALPGLFPGQVGQDAYGQEGTSLRELEFASLQLEKDI
ncbi:MAG TPA: hypothetical protein VNU72_02680 [Puia sp.]|jgi:hypothetical protein|nr:hypothetical protein [Puia sp.]